MRLIFTIFCLYFSFGLSGQLINIPDSSFKSALINNGVDLNGDSEIQFSEAEMVDSLDIRSLSISNLSGIEHFINLIFLNCRRNDLESIDLSNNTKLEYLACGVNELDVLDVSTLIELTYLSCDHNSLLDLDLTNNRFLRTLIVNNNYISNLSFVNSSELEFLNCRINNLSSLDFSDNLKLEFLNCERNKIENLISGHNILLKELKCGGNELSTLNTNDLLGLKELNCGGNKIEVLNVVNLDSLMSLSCNDNELAELNIIDCSSLNYLNLRGNSVSSIDLSSMHSLAFLYCESNILNDLSVSNNINLIQLWCSDNPLEYLDLITLSKLELLVCRNTQIEELDLSNCPNFIQAEIEDNNLVNLNLKNGSIESSLRFGGNENLKYICCDDNQLERIIDLVNDINLPILINSYCSDYKGTNRLEGSVYYANSIDECNSTEFKLKFFKLRTIGINNEGSIYTNNQGDFDLELNEQSIILSQPSSFNSQNFSFQPISQEYTFDTTNTYLKNDFCIYPIELFGDVSVNIIPIGTAQSGFSSSYKIIIENKGSMVSSGRIRMNFENDLMKHIGSIPTVS